MNFVRSGEKEKALRELQNLRMNANYCLNNINFPSYAFACFIHSINKEVMTDYSETGLAEVIKKFKDHIPQGIIESIVDDLKKKLKSN
jgi:hypothetical protein